MSNDPKKVQDWIAEARASAEAIAASLPTKVEVRLLTLKSKIPFKAQAIRELLIHRVSSLGMAAVDLYEKRESVPAALLTRAVMETLAVTYALVRAIDAFLISKDEVAFDNFLMVTLMGSRKDDWEYRSTNILTQIEKVTRLVPEFARSYEALSEFAHPNWGGVLGSFGQIDRDKLELRLGKRERDLALGTGAPALSGALYAFRHFYDEMVNPLFALNEYFENRKG